MCVKQGMTHCEGSINRWEVLGVIIAGPKHSVRGYEGMLPRGNGINGETLRSSRNYSGEGLSR